MASARMVNAQYQLSCEEKVNLLGSFVAVKDSMNEMNVYLKCMS